MRFLIANISKNSTKLAHKQYLFNLLLLKFFRDAEVQRIDSKIVSTLSQYSMICRHAREDVKNTFSARDKELARRKHIDKLLLKEQGKSQTVVSIFFYQNYYCLNEIFLMISI